MASKYQRKPTREEARIFIPDLLRKRSDFVSLRYQYRDNKDPYPVTLTLFVHIERAIDWSNEKQRWEDNGYRMCNAMFRKDLSLKNRNDEDCKRVFFKRENVDLETMINACEKMGFIRG